MAPSRSCATVNENCGDASRHFEVAASCLLLGVADHQGRTHGKTVADGADFFCAVGDRLLLRRFERVIAVRNNLKAAL